MKKEDKEIKKDWANAMKIFATVSSWIVGPIILAVLVGNWLDEKYQTDNFFILTAVAIAFIMTCVGIVREAKRIL